MKRALKKEENTKIRRTQKEREPRKDKTKEAAKGKRGKKSKEYKKEELQENREGEKEKGINGEEKISAGSGAFLFQIRMAGASGGDDFRSDL